MEPPDSDEGLSRIQGQQQAHGINRPEIDFAGGEFGYDVDR